MTFFDPEDQELFRVRLLRHPEYMEFLQYDLRHHKDEMLACEGCSQAQSQNLPCSETSASLLDGVIDHSQARIPTAPSMLNLLPELLLEIFCLLTWEDPPCIRETWDVSETKVVAVPHLGWIHVTHVCRRWRHLAVGQGALWTNLGYGLALGRSWTQEFLARAKGANVSIPAFDDHPQSIGMIYHYILDHLPHIRDLILSAESTSMELMWNVCERYLPMIVSANLDAGSENWHSENLFGGYAPNLRRLRLYNIFPWKAHTFLENLTELHVFVCDDRGLTTSEGEIEPMPLFVYPPLSQVLDVLDEAFRLEHLSLHYAFPPEDFTADDSRKVQFPRLKSFSMAHKVRDCVSFMKRIDMPHDTMLDLTCILGLSRDKFRDLLRTLTHRMHNAGNQCPPIERLELGAARFDDRAFIRVYGGQPEMDQDSDDRLTNYRSLELSHVSPRPTVTLSLAYASPQDHEVVLHDFFSLMPVQAVIYLSIYRCSTVEPEGWRSIIRNNHAHLQSVRFLVLGHDCAQFFFHAIHDGDDLLSGFGPPTFPSLDRLIFRRVNFSMFDRGDVSEASFQDQMLYHLRERVRRGRPLRAVFFFSCQGIDEEWFRDLEEVVKFVRLGL